jgi:Family of unknown function (DUF5681)
MQPELDYEVGYGKPPKHSQFPNGQSGNSKGRPRGSKNKATLFDEALDERITITENGKRRKITKRKAGYKQLANQVAQGDHRATQIMLKHDQDNDRRRAEQKKAEPPAAPAPSRGYVVVLPHNGRDPIDPELKEEYKKAAIRFFARKEREAARLKAANENVEEETSSARGQAA